MKLGIGNLFHTSLIRLWYFAFKRSSTTSKTWAMFFKIKKPWAIFGNWIL